MYDVRLNFLKLFPQKKKSQQFTNFPQTQNIMGYQLLLMDIKSQDQWFEEEFLRKWGSDYKIIRG